MANRIPAHLSPVFRMALCASAMVAAGKFAAAAQGDTLIGLSVDATEAARGIFHSQVALPVQPGPLTLVYPKWIPGAHGPVGPIVNVVGLQLSAGGKTIPWRRDDVDMYAFHCDIPPGETTLEARFDFVSPSQAHSLAVITWNQLLLYPQGPASDDLKFEAHLKLPAGWKFGGPLPVASESAGQIAFKPVSLTTLVDSPVLAGAHYRTIPLNAGQLPSHVIDMVSDSEAALDMKPDLVEQYQRLVYEAGGLFGARHYTTYHWLVTFNSHVGGGGLEHHESSDDRVDENALSTDGGKRRLAWLLAHEYVHSWNGKYRRPAGLATPDYQQPMKGELLWVYEGLTDYLGSILCPRAGLVAAADFREHLAEVAATMEYTRGRSWRPLIDTTIGAQVLYQSPPTWRDYRRSTDFYPEGVLLWLEADVMIRQQSQGKRSLNDFCRMFHGGENSAPMLKPYTQDEVISTLNAVAPYDWKGFWETRLHSTDAHAPLGGVAGSGWKLVFSDAANDEIKYRETQQKVTNLTYSLGLLIGNEDGLVRDIVPGLPADHAGIAPGMKIIAVNGRKWTPDLLREAVKASKSSSGPLELLVEDNEFYKTYALDYHDGARYPHLQRDDPKPDLLEQIIKPLAAPSK